MFCWYNSLCYTEDNYCYKAGFVLDFSGSSLQMLFPFWNIIFFKLAITGRIIGWSLINGLARFSDDFTAVTNHFAKLFVIFWRVRSVSPIQYLSTLCNPSYMCKLISFVILLFLKCFPLLPYLVNNDWVMGDPKIFCGFIYKTSPETEITGRTVFWKRNESLLLISQRIHSGSVSFTCCSQHLELLKRSSQCFCTAYSSLALNLNIALC